MEDGPNETPDQALLRRLRESDSSCLADIYRAYGPPIELWIQKKCRWLDTEDILATAIWRLWEKRETIETKYDSVRPFLFKVAQRLAISQLRSPLGQLRFLELAMEEIPELADANQAEGDLVPESNNRDLSILTDIVATLPAIDRRIVIYRVQTGPKYADELAEELSMTPAAVRQRLSRAMTRICDEFNTRRQNDERKSEGVR